MPLKIATRSPFWMPCFFNAPKRPADFSPTSPQLTPWYVPACFTSMALKCGENSQDSTHKNVGSVFPSKNAVCGTFKKSPSLVRILLLAEALQLGTLMMEWIAFFAAVQFAAHWIGYWGEFFMRFSSSGPGAARALKRLGWGVFALSAGSFAWGGVGRLFGS